MYSYHQYIMKYSGDVLCFECITGTYRLRFLAGKTEGAEHILAVGRHSSMHMCADDASTTSVWAAPHNKIIVKRLLLYQRTETSLFEKISKKKYSPCRDDSMPECTGWQSTKTRHTIEIPTMLQPKNMVVPRQILVGCSKQAATWWQPCFWNGYWVVSGLFRPWTWL